jgi:hypothetical protein
VRSSRSAVLLVAAPGTIYLALLWLVAGLHTHPSSLGWTGLGAVTALAAAVAAGAAILFPRMRASVEPVEAPDRHRLLVLADTACSGERLCDTVAARLAGRDAEVLVVAPVLASPLHYLTGQEDGERRAAQTRLDEVVRGLRRRGLHVEGRLGDDDPLQALGDALTGFPAGEALVVTAPGPHWLEGHVFERARRLVPVLEHVEA